MPIFINDLVLEDIRGASGISFGGSQILAVHRLPGGGRVVDALGGSDADLRWRGVLRGSAAYELAQELDSLRVAGAPVSLSWGQAAYTVLIAELDLEFDCPWWIPYSIRCTVANALPASAGFMQGGATNAALADITSASAWFDVGSLAASVTATSGSAPVAQAVALAQANFTTVKASLSSALQVAQTDLNSAFLIAQTSAAGALAGLVAAQSFLGRANTNFRTAIT